MAKPTLGLNYYNYNDRLVRIIVANDGQPWMVVEDALRAIGHDNINNAFIELKLVGFTKEIRRNQIIHTPTGDLELATINAVGLLLLPHGTFEGACTALRDWFTTEVSPLIKHTFPQDRMTCEPLSEDELPLAQINEKAQAQAKLITLHESQIETLIKNQAAMAAQLDGIAHMVVVSEYALRDMKLNAGPMTIGGTAKLLGTLGDRLIEFLMIHNVLSHSTTSGIIPLKPFKEQGYFESVPELFGKQLNVSCPEIRITPAGRRWLHHNACLGWLDCILIKHVLATRINSAPNLPLPLSVLEPKP